MNTKLLFVSLITLLVISKSDNDNDENYDKMMKKKEQLKPFYDALMEPGLGANGGDNDKLDKLMGFMDDEFEYCSRDQIDKGSECKNKKKFRDDMKQKKDDGYYGYKIDIDSIDDDDNYVSVKCQIIFVDEKTGCRTTTKQTDDFYYTKNGKIKLLEAKYEGATKKCPVDSKGNNDNKPSTTKPKHVQSPPNKDNIYAEYERMRDEQRNMYKPLTTKSGKEAPRYRSDKEEESNNKDREDKLKDFYKTALECGLKKNEDNDGMMDKVMDYFNDDVDVCSPDGDNMKIENKKCYRGKDAVKNMMQRTFNGEYESIDYTLTIKKKEENYDEVELNGSYKDEDGCIIEVKETDGIHYDSYGKIKILNVKDSVVTSDPEKCGDKKDKSKSMETKKEDSYSKYYVFPEDKKDKPATTEYKHDKKAKTDKPETTEYKYVKEAPQDRFHREDTSNNKPSTTKPKYDQQPPNKDSIYAEYGEMTEEKNKNTDKPSTTKEAPRYRFHRKETNDKDKQEEQLNDFYKTMLECALKKTEDIDIMMDKLTDYFSDDIEFCSPDGDNMNIENKKCYHGKDAVKSMMKRTFNGKYKSVDYNLLFKIKEERFVEVEVKKSYQDEDGCTIEVKQTDRIYYDSYGKIEVFNVKDSVVTRDPEKCSGNKDASKSKEDDYSKKVPVIPQYKSAKPSTTESERVKEAPQYRFHRETASDSNKDKPSTTKSEYERMGEEKNKDKPSSTEKDVDVSNNKDREEKLKDFYKSAVECGMKEDSDADEVIDKLMDEFSDNISLCAPDGGVDGEDMSYKNKKCYHGKEAVRNFLENIIDCKYKVIDHKFRVIENEKSMIRVEIENKYRDEAECVIHFKETIDIYYNNKGKIVIYDVVDSLVYPKKCDFEDVEHLE